MDDDDDDDVVAWLEFPTTSYTSENYWRDRRTSAGIAKGHRNLPGIIFIFLSVTGLDPLYDVFSLSSSAFKFMAKKYPGYMATRIQLPRDFQGITVDAGGRFLGSHVRPAAMQTRVPWSKCITIRE
ncbi:uncharacterized protein BO87DRAFT_413973 [Aspergillus neoniger CBS 115656]|uniref:Uncharacterized protein n=1 Tax=Aspergillus neoniger (strain CBS 115656) TaxID=1448310 RepID=A0A318YXZ0_ASPNB|nr:hypothetical protein BO87DRAFT_413973 [Aspergillus neoniger CBS 115656]PYH36610.1 hypothetical protein BO87DRAFT_413973 [Aspergillus neoniger CBS 115656]